MRRLVGFLCLILGACGTSSNGDDGPGPVPCIEDMHDVPFADEDPMYAEVHEAIGTVPGSYVAMATWYGRANPIEITTTLAFASGSYALEVVDETAYCRLSVSVSIHVTIETSDGGLVVDTVSDWSMAQLTEPNAHAELIGLVVGLTTDPQNPAWFDASIAELWPDIASLDDDAELRLLVEHHASSISGQITYTKREIIDDTTVVYDTEVLLEWSS